MEEQKNAIIVHEESKLSEIDISERRIQGLIHIIRGKQVMLDSDLAMLYQVETKRINESVKRNIKRFPVEFCFKLSEEEVLNLKSQIATSSLARFLIRSRSHFATLKLALIPPPSAET